MRVCDSVLQSSYWLEVVLSTTMFRDNRSIAFAASLPDCRPRRRRHCQPRPRPRPCSVDVAIARRIRKAIFQRKGPPPSFLLSFYPFCQCQPVSPRILRRDRVGHHQCTTHQASCRSFLSSFYFFFFFGLGRLLLCLLPSISSPTKALYLDSMP